MKSADRIHIRLLVPTLAPILSRALVQIAVTSKKRPVCAMENSSPKHGIPDLRRGLTLNAQTSQSELSLPDTVQQLDAGDGDRCIPKSLEAEHHSNALLHTRWSCSIRLFRYFDERSLVFAGS